MITIRLTNANFIKRVAVRLYYTFTHCYLTVVTLVIVCQYNMHGRFVICFLFPKRKINRLVMT